MTEHHSEVSKKDEARYFQDASEWDREIIEEIKQSRRNAWIVAGTSLGLLAVAIGAIFALTPLHTIEPYLVRVDSSTGIVDQVVRIRDAKTDYDELISKYFLRKVVTLRESYTRAQLDYSYKQLVLFTAPSARPALKQAFAFENLAGPYKRYGENGTAVVHIKTTSFISKNIAQIRYVRFDLKAGAEVPTHWIATIEFRYVAQPASEEARAINPLGFQVTNYRNDPEAVIDEPKPGEPTGKAGEAAKPEDLTAPIIPPPRAIEAPNPLEAPKPISTGVKP